MNPEQTKVSNSVYERVLQKIRQDKLKNGTQRRSCCGGAR
jgi:hypothetical protein